MDNQCVNCTRCKNFYITFDRSYPNGCRLFGFKSSKLPSITVKEATGDNCSNYQLKNGQCAE